MFFRYKDDFGSLHFDEHTSIPFFLSLSLSLFPLTRGTIALFKERAKDTKTIRALNYRPCRVKPYYSYNCKRRMNNMEGKCLLAGWLAG